MQLDPRAFLATADRLAGHVDDVAARCDAAAARVEVLLGRWRGDAADQFAAQVAQWRGSAEAVV